MRVVVTGATGFVGRHVVAALLDAGHAVTAVARNSPGAELAPWVGTADFVAIDTHAATDPAAALGVPDALVHLAWPGLPNYRDRFHFEHNLLADYRFIERMVVAGTPQVLVTGTCFEYGMQSGCLDEDTPALPNNPYGIAKNTLRLFLEMLQRDHPFALQWVRLFYLHGTGQNPRSVLAQLDAAIDEGRAQFDMSGGEQLRDYLPVATAAANIAALVGRPAAVGVVNCCSGEPISVRRLVEQRIAERGARMTLNLGHFTYPDYEPFAFWGSRRRFDDLLGEPKLDGCSPPSSVR